MGLAVIMSGNDDGANALIVTITRITATRITAMVGGILRFSLAGDISNPAARYICLNRPRNHNTVLVIEI